MKQSIAQKIGQNQAHPRTKQQQIELNLFWDHDGPEAHLIALTDYKKFGTSCVWTPREYPEWHCLRETDEIDFDAICKRLNEWYGANDVYITVNEFKGWRTIERLLRINAVFVDIDKCDFPSAAGIAQLYMLEKLGWPMPNIIVKSGRGAHFYWLLSTPLPPAALPRWTHLQKRLNEALGGDKGAADAARVLRLIGSVNSKNGRQVTAKTYHRSRYSFEHLFDEIADSDYAAARKNGKNGKSKASITDIRKAAADRGRRPGASHAGNRWYLVYMDLRYIVDKAFGGVIPKAPPDEKGHRNNFIWIYAVALSWFTVSDALDYEVLEVAAKIAPSLTKAEVLSYTTSVRRRAEYDAKQLAKDPAWQSKELNKSRYRFRRETLYNLLKDYITDDMLPHLKAIIPNDVARQRKTERDDQRYASKVGGEVRAYGKRNAGKKDQAWIYHCDGHSVRQIAEKLSISPDTASRWIRAKIAESSSKK